MPDPTITRTYCARPGCDGNGFYSARCKSQDHETREVVYAPVPPVSPAVEEPENLRRTPITLDACYREMERIELEHAAEIEAFKDTIAIGGQRHAEQIRKAVDENARLRAEVERLTAALDRAGRALNRAGWVDESQAALDLIRALAGSPSGKETPEP